MKHCIGWKWLFPSTSLRKFSSASVHQLPYLSFLLSAPCPPFLSSIRLKVKMWPSSKRDYTVYLQYNIRLQLLFIWTHYRSERCISDYWEPHPFSMLSEVHLAHWCPISYHLLISFYPNLLENGKSRLEVDGIDLAGICGARPDGGSNRLWRRRMPGGNMLPVPNSPIREVR